MNCETSLSVELPDAARFNRNVRTLRTPIECGAAFRALIAPLGFDTFACGELDLDHRERNTFYIIDWPERWTRFYTQSGLIERDPIVTELAVRHAPFTWSELRADRKLSQAGTDALNLAAASGWNEGLVVPLPTGGRRIGLVSMAGSTTVTSALRDHLALLSVCLHSHVRTLVAREGFPLPPAGLSPREVECVRLVARGKSDGGIAAALGIAPSTAHEFVEKAKRKLRAKSRAELIAVAVALAIIEL
ncbi:LuxR family transcriptional regulator [Sphingomonas nostoxanthinifaciens]|uniref:LuxR family transcriptional regulator n=1 Tax=Sphingomonas nostoxanthinifaciens TaxID=2872652 RepID=UPI001CC1EEAB|nr:LuxR family transcriptional regulator [Sphingomonas nostoxanthinifaciens]UAK24217.1 LuxR family transcriptional regulator [Sphingomonas nostoxanthinifaciens]